jgi:hypothetical protein
MLPRAFAPRRGTGGYCLSPQRLVMARLEIPASSVRA